MEQAFATPLCLAMGNRKVGRVWTFSLPSLLTCPGASAWCRDHCYARRMEQFRPNCRTAYLRNLLVSDNVENFVRQTLQYLPDDAPLVRIHVSGDFYSSTYTDAWTRICQARPHTRFWSYTRSWRVKELAPSLQVLAQQANMQLFASLDPGMPMPPNGWRNAFVETDPRAQGMPCRHQQGEVDTCLECGYCFRENTGHVVFKVH